MEIRFIGSWQKTFISSDDIQAFTGDKDIRGIKIFEGDVVSYYEKLDEHGQKQQFKGVVALDLTKGEFGIKGKTSFLNYLSDNTIFGVLVIGNIARNPSLIKLLT